MLKIPPKKICKRLKLIKNIGFCKTYNIPCRCYYCDCLKFCRRDNLPCELIENQVIQIKNKVSIKFLKKMVYYLKIALMNILNKFDLKQRVIYLTYLRELSLLSTITAPGDYLIIPLLNKLLNKLSYNLNDFSTEDFVKSKINPKTSYILSYLFAHLVVFDMWITLIRNSDGILLFAKKNLNEIFRLIKNVDIDWGVKYSMQGFFINIENEHNFDDCYRKVIRGDKTIYRRKKILKTKETSYFFSLSNNMEKSYIWARINDIDPCNGFVNLKYGLKRLKDHLCKVGEKGTLNPSECYRIALPFHFNLLHLLKNLIVRDVFFRENQDNLKVFYQNFEKEFNQILHHKIAYENFNIRIIWDNIIMSIYEMEQDKIISSKKLINNFSNQWQFRLKNGILMGSVLFFSLISMYFKDLFLTKKERGQFLEDYIELLIKNSQNAQIISKNEQYETGEIDFIALINNEYYLIEAKNYGPWHAKEGEFSYYIGSLDFKRRLDKLQGYINKLEQKLNYVQINKQKFNIPETEEINKGLIITYFKEIYLTIPLSFQLISLKTFEDLLGYSPLERLNFKIGSPKDSENTITKIEELSEEKEWRYII